MEQKHSNMIHNHGAAIHHEHSGSFDKDHDATGGNSHLNHLGIVDIIRKRFWVCLVLSIPILLLSPMIQTILGLGELLRFTGDEYVLFFISSIVYFYGGYPFLKGLVDEFKNQKPGMMTLISVAISTAYLYSSMVVFGLKGMSFFWELATLIDIMLLGHWIEMKSVMGASKALEELVKLMPAEAHKLTVNGKIIDVPLGTLEVSDKIIIKPGEKIPADGMVITGLTTVNESMITGESIPVSKEKGSRVIGGSINGEGSITVIVEKTGKDSFLAQVVELVNQAQESKSKTQDLANRAALWLTIVALAGGAITLFTWYFIINMDFAFALERTVTLMVTTCPHALGLAIPLVAAVSTSLAAKDGLLIRNRTAFEKARNIDAVVFDKTGTLTESKFGITDIVIYNDKNPEAVINEQKLLTLAASVESKSEHPIARGIIRSAGTILPVENFRSITGKGAEGMVDGIEVKVVSPGYLKEVNIPYEEPRVSELFEQGKTVVFVVVGGELKGAIALADTIRPESQRAVSILRSMGIKCMMLSGDNKQVAKWVSKEIGLDEYFAEVLPQEKARKIKDVQSRGMTVAMVGDGVNDAPALAQADVGIAIGAGTDVAIETADVVLVKSNPLDVIVVINLARATYRKMVQNLLWATGYNVLAIPMAAGLFFESGIVLSPAIGAMLMSLSTVIVAINSRRLKIWNHSG